MNFVYYSLIRYLLLKAVILPNLHTGLFYTDDAHYQTEGELLC